MSKREYEVRLEPQDGGGFTVLVPELPDVVTEGQTREEALAMAEDAIDGYLEAVRDGYLMPPMPQERSG